MNMGDVEHIVEGRDHMKEGDDIVDGNVTTAIKSGCRSSVCPHSKTLRRASSANAVAIMSIAQQRPQIG
jgi:hypothetical protein